VVNNSKAGQSLVAVVVIVVVMGSPLTSCHEPPSQPSAEGNITAVRSIRLATQQASPESASFRIAREVPEFGGYWFDKGGNLHAFITDARAASRLRSSLLPVFGRIRPSLRRPLDANRSIILHEGHYTFPQLVRWKVSIGRAAGMLDELQFLAVSPINNKVRIGVVTNAGAESIRRLLPQIGIPLDAVKFEVGGRVRMLQGGLPTLNDSVTPRIGGLQIELLAPGFDSLCTLGINVNGGTGFLTASHCTYVRGPDPVGSKTYAFQPLIGVNILADESLDPPYVSNEEIDCCPLAQGDRCRWSDAAMFTYRSGQSPGMSGQGKIARTQISATGDGNSGSVRINGVFNILGSYSMGFNDLFDKVGSTTGWTYGTVVDACVDIPSGPVANRYWYICQAEITGSHSAQGDSGGPVFLLTLDGNVWWGGLAVASHSYTHNLYVSRMEKIYDELGYFDIAQ
jgi:hypothetical protein